MKIFFGFIGGVALLLMGNAIVSFATQLLFDYTPYWLAAVLGVVITMVVLTKSVGLAFYKFPYVILGIDKLSLFQIMYWLLVIGVLIAIFKHKQFYGESLSPKWLRIFADVYCVMIAYSYRKDVKAWLWMNDGG